MIPEPLLHDLRIDYLEKGGNVENDACTPFHDGGSVVCTGTRDIVRERDIDAVRRTNS
jgi:hypothetical protein